MKTDEIIDEILSAEGGYVDDPADRGGCTNFGITLATLAEWRGGEVDCEDVRALTETEARDIYYNEYIQRPGFDRLPREIQPLMVDSAVQHGPRAVIKWLQKAVGAAPDGVIGPQTINAVMGSDLEHVHNSVLAKRVRFYGAIISNDHSQARFAEGWMNRVTKFLTQRVE
jgi:lysozyme family protein